MGDTTVDAMGGDGYDGGTEQGSSGNAAWQPFLDAIPQDLHQTVTPILQEWDRNVSNRFTKVHQEYEEWKPLKEAGVSPEDVQFSLQFLNALQNNPEEVYKTLGEHYKFNQPTPNSSGQGQDGSEAPNQDQLRYEELKKQTDLVSQYLVEQHKQQQIAAENAKYDQILDKEISDLKKQYGNFDEETVLMYMANGIPGQEAVARYNKLVGNNSPKPIFAGGSSGIPGTGSVDVTKMSEQQRKAYAIQLAKAYSRQNQE